MIIGIDASRAIRTEQTGTERYSLEIIRHLLALPEANKHQWRLYTNEPIADDSPLATCHLPANIQANIQANIEIRVLHQQRLWTHLALASELLRQPPDVVFIPAHVLPFVLPVDRLPPSVVTIHDLGYHFFPEAHTWQQKLYLEWSTRWSAWAATRLVAISRATANDLTTVYKTDARKIRVIYEAATLVPPLKFAGSLLDGSPIDKPWGNRPYVLFIGTIQPRKNLTRLMQAYAKIHQQVDWDLVLVGKLGWLSSSLHEKSKILTGGERIHFAGYLSEQTAAHLLIHARFFCFPSLFEGFGLPVLEAQQAGVPVITSTNSSLPEVAGDAALLVDPTDVDAIAEAMLRLTHDETLRQRLIAAGHENVKRFSWEKAARETLAVLEEAAKRTK